MELERKVVVIVQARMGSSRLPGKVTKDLLGKPMLGHLIDRLKKAEKVNQIVIATSRKKIDDPVEEIANKQNVNCYRGSENDVLSRYVEASKKYNADIIVRITGDCPLIDPVTVDNVIKKFLNSQLDYIGNKGYPRGLDTEVFSFKALLKMKKLLLEEVNEVNSSYREHVTLYIYRHPEKFNIDFYFAPENLKRDYRLCVDELDDFKLIEEIYNRLYKKDRLININDVINLLDNQPELVNINRYVEQKKV